MGNTQTSSNEVEGKNINLDSSPPTTISETTMVFNMFDFHSYGVCNYLAIAFILLLLLLGIFFFRYRLTSCFKWLQGKPSSCFKCLQGKPSSATEGANR